MCSSDLFPSHDTAVLLLLWIRLKKKTILLNLKLKEMKSSNIWKIVIGAVSAALGYILNSIGL